MKKHAFGIAIVVFITLTDLSISSAQSTTQNRSTDARAILTREKTFVAKPITIETPTGTLYGTLALPQSQKSIPVY